jgi:hypothetical protein
MPYGAFINTLPPAFFLAVHLIGFLLGASFAYRAFGAPRADGIGDSQQPPADTDKAR